MLQLTHAVLARLLCVLAGSGSKGTPAFAAQSPPLDGESGNNSSRESMHPLPFIHSLGASCLSTGLQWVRSRCRRRRSRAGELNALLSAASSALRAGVIHVLVCYCSARRQMQMRSGSSSSAGIGRSLLHPSQRLPKIEDSCESCPLFCSAWWRSCRPVEPHEPAEPTPVERRGSVVILPCRRSGEPALSCRCCLAANLAAETVRCCAAMQASPLPGIL
jgi:hypothetical protein